MSENIPQLTITAPAKINLHLEVKDRRPDGFHNLESIFLALNFGDTLYFEPILGKNSVEMAAVEGVGFEENIIFKALSLFRGRTGFDQGLKIGVKKRIPIGGGLGGGSSNAASTLLALNKLTGNPLDRAALLDMAASLGSDVPFFIHETAAALITGRGEHIEPLTPPNLFFVLVYPGFSSSTALAFRLLDEYRNHKIIKQRELNGSFSASAPREPLVRRLCERNFEFFYNDFLEIFPEHEKNVYYRIISQLKKLGADFASLSGAGSTCFGVFNEKESAEKAAAVLRDKWKFVENSCLIKA